MSEFSKSVVDFTERFHERHGLLPIDASSLHKGGGGDGGGMEARIAKLEVHMDHMHKSMGASEARLGKIEDRVNKVETTLATLTERVAHLPSKGFIVATTLSSLAVISAVILFADKIKSLIAG